MRTLYFKTVKELKEYNNFKSGDCVKTAGYYKENDNGNAKYKIVTLNEYKNLQPNDIKNAVNSADEYGSFTVNDNLIASIIINKSTTPEQWGAIGNGIFNNTIPFIHMFSKIKTGCINFKSNARYLFDDVWEEYKNPYKTSMIGKPLGGYETSKPLLANIKNLTINGKNANIIVENFAKTDRYDVDFAIFQLGGYIYNLNINNLCFNGKFWLQDYSKTKSSYRNHGIAYLGNRNSESTINGLTVEHCTFLNLGCINSDSNDYGGDGVLLMFPSDVYNVNIINNTFIDVGRWAFAMDTANLENYFKVNKILIANNTFIQNDYKSNYDPKNKSIRALGFIDFEAGYDWKNIFIYNNNLSAPSIGIAFGGSYKHSKGIYIFNNTYNTTTSPTIGYPYIIYIYNQDSIDDIYIDNNYFNLEIVRMDDLITLAPKSKELGYAHVEGNTFKINTITWKNNEHFIMLDNLKLLNDILIKNNITKSIYGLVIKDTNTTDENVEINIDVVENDFSQSRTPMKIENSNSKIKINITDKPT